MPVYIPLRLGRLRSVGIPPSLDTYEGIVDGLPGGPPLVHYRLGESIGPTMFDRKAGQRHGIYFGSLGFGAVSLPRKSDTAVDFNSVGYAEVAHDSGLALSSLSLSIWFQVHEYPSTEGEGREVIISKGQVGAVLGDFDVIMEDGGNILVQFQTDGGQQPLNGPSVALNKPHNLVVRADNTGFDAYLNGISFGKITGYTSAWISNTQPLRLAAAPWAFISGGTWPTNGIFFNGILDEVALYARQLSEPEILTLAQYNARPIANADTMVVAEEKTTVLDVVNNDIYTGLKSALGMEVSTVPVSTWDNSVVTTHATATVRTDRKVDLAAGSVTQHEQDQFAYRITDGFGTSDPAIVSLTVFDSATGGGGDDGRGGTLVYLWEPLASWIDGIPLEDRDTNDIDGIGGGTGPGTLSWWQDGANPANGGGRVGHDIIQTVNWIGIHNVCWNRAPTGHPALEMYNPTSLNSPATFDLYPFHPKGDLPTNPRHVRMVVEYMHCTPALPTTYKGQGLGSQSGSYTDFRDSFQNPGHSGKYMTGLTGGRFGRGSCSTNWYAKSNYPRDVAYFASAFRSSGDLRSYSYFYSRDTDCGGFNGYNGIANFLRPEWDGKWNRLEFEMKLQNPSLVNSSWSGTSFPTGGDGFIKMFYTTDLEGTPSERTQYIDHQGLVIFGADNNNHQRCAINGPFIYQYHGGVATPNVPTWGWVRRIECYHYQEDDI